VLSANSRSSILFNEVLDYAGQDEDRFFLVSIPGRPAPNGRHAAFYRPGSIDEDPDDILHGPHLALANGPDVRDRHGRPYSLTSTGMIRNRRPFSQPSSGMRLVMLNSGTSSARSSLTCTT
jgi:hypothetical protein